MATRFLAVIGHGADADAGFVAHLRKNTGFTVAIDHAPLTVLVEDIAGVVSCGRDDCVTLGWLFGRSDFRRRAMIDASTVDAMERGNFTPLLRDYWGGYVALVADRKTSAVTVLRDPSGGLPCYYHRTPAATFLFSDLATWREANLEPVAVDWTGVGHRLSTASLPSSRTALEGVNELCAGFALEISDRPALAKAAWSPWDHVSTAPDRSTADLPITLRDTVMLCVGAWAGQFASVLLNLSGGLDSSIIAAGLAGRKNSDAAITMATRSPSGDERDFARSVAAATGLHLSEGFYETSDVDITRPSLPDLPRPNGRAIGQAFEAARQRFAAERASDAFFTGLGGDNVFCYLQSPTPAADRLKAHGPSVALRETIDSVCMQTGCSVTTAWWWAVQRAWLSAPRYRWRRYALFLDPDCVAHERDLAHPWLAAPAGALPGKAAHIAMLMRVQAELDCYARGSAIPIIAPLLSQPIMELCLSIPTWQWSAHGHDRAVARDAFAGLLPAAVIQRRTKAGPEAFCYEIIARDRQLLREHLLDGALAGHGILDRLAIETVLDNPAPPSGDHFLRLLELADAEAWVRHWSRGA